MSYSEVQISHSENGAVFLLGLHFTSRSRQHFGLNIKSNMMEMQSQGSSLRVKCMQGSCLLLSNQAAKANASNVVKSHPQKACIWH